MQIEKDISFEIVVTQFGPDGGELFKTEYEGDVIVHISGSIRNCYLYQKIRRERFPVKVSEIFESFEIKRIKAFFVASYWGDAKEVLNIERHI